jgi:adenylate kinase family enzyme
VGIFSLWDDERSVVLGLMKNILIFGNSGSGKSTLAKQLAAKHTLAHLDLDTLAWLPTSPPSRMPLAESIKQIEAFTSNNQSWVIEGCYADLLAKLVDKTSQMIFVNPGVDICINNCKQRPWEAHKYPSKKEQDANLAMLIEWIKQYPKRKDEFSLLAHRTLFEQFTGNKLEYQSNHREII